MSEAFAIKALFNSGETVKWCRVETSGVVFVSHWTMRTLVPDEAATRAKLRQWRKESGFDLRLVRVTRKERRTDSAQDSK